VCGEELRLRYGWLRASPWCWLARLSIVCERLTCLAPARLLVFLLLLLLLLLLPFGRLLLAALPQHRRRRRQQH